MSGMPSGNNLIALYNDWSMLPKVPNEVGGGGGGMYDASIRSVSGASQPTVRQSEIPPVLATTYFIIIVDVWLSFVTLYFSI
jgi:hypothetical protein